MKSELQKAKDKAAKEKDQFAAWLFKTIQKNPRGTMARLAEYLNKPFARVHEYSRGLHYPDVVTRVKIKKFFEK